MLLLLSKKNLYLLTGIFLFACGLAFGPVWQRSAHAQTTAYIALVIDDLGNNGEGLAEILHLGVPLTVAVLPFLPASRHDAELARQAGHEVILHIPMEPRSGSPAWLGSQPITVDLGDEEIKARIRHGLAEIYGAVGMNNHMGSKATTDARVMRAVLAVAKERRLFFVDSRTADSIVVATTAKSLRVPCIRRNVFLDGAKSEEFVRQRLLILAQIARSRGCAVGIGHVGPEGGMSTVRGIKNALPMLRRMGIEFVSVSRLLGRLPVKGWLSSSKPEYLNDEMHRQMSVDTLFP